MPPRPPPTYMMLLQSLMIVTSTMTMMSEVNSYDDQSGFCAGPENVCRYSNNKLPAGVTQYDIYANFHARAFDSRAICRRLDGLSADANFKVYAYFSCNLEHCFDCYDDAFMSLRTTYGCSEKDGGFITLDGCCLRYETYNFCGAGN
ncbi:hypothetical protein LINGRAHAP2_LOCUS26156 [Linum grandiflorum]